MPFISTKDSTEIYYKDWGNTNSPVVVFSHGWPLNSDNWESQMFFLANQGYRVVAHDRRGGGRSSQPWQSNTLDQYADDLAELLEKLDLKNAMLVGHSTGGGEIARYIGRHGSSRVSKVVLISSITPLMLKTESHPYGVPKEVLNSFRTAMANDRSQFFLDVASGPFYGFNREGVEKREGLIRSWWHQGMTAGFKASYDCVAAWEQDLSEDMKKMDMPTLVIHATDDQVVPIDAAGRAAVKLLPHGKLVEFPGGSHGLPNTEPEWVNNRLLEWLKA